MYRTQTTGQSSTQFVERKWSEEVVCGKKTKNCVRVAARNLHSFFKLHHSSLITSLHEIVHWQQQAASRKEQCPLSSSFSGLQQPGPSYEKKEALG